MAHQTLAFVVEETGASSHHSILTLNRAKQALSTVRFDIYS